MLIIISKKKSWFVESAQLSVLEVELNFARSMELTLLNSSASSAAQSLSGSVGVTLIFVSHAIRSNAVVIMFLEKQKNSCQNVQGRQNVH